MNEQNNFYQEILGGLMAPQKRISSKFLYDSQGAEIFNQITTLPEYYLTNCEKEILETQSQHLVQFLGSDPFHLVELGPGDGSKARIVIEKLKEQKMNFDYYAVDICEAGLNIVQNELQDTNIDINLLCADFVSGVHHLSDVLIDRKVILFLGSSIGNMTRAESQNFIYRLSEHLNDGDLLIVGFDLKKDVEVLEKAYNDSQGLTAEFNYNLLRRLNSELGANFEVKNFKHLEFYSHELGAMVSYLVSQKDQEVKVGSHTIRFKKNERLHTEYSFKYNDHDIKKMIQNSGLASVKNLTDSKEYFTCAVFKKHTPDIATLMMEVRDFSVPY